MAPQPPPPPPNPLPATVPWLPQSWAILDHQPRVFNAEPHRKAGFPVLKHCVYPAITQGKAGFLVLERCLSSPVAPVVLAATRPTACRCGAMAWPAFTALRQDHRLCWARLPSAAPPSTFSRRFNTAGKRVARCLHCLCGLDTAFARCLHCLCGLAFARCLHYLCGLDTAFALRSHCLRGSFKRVARAALRCAGPPRPPAPRLETWSSSVRLAVDSLSLRSERRKVVEPTQPAPQQQHPPLSYDAE